MPGVFRSRVKMDWMAQRMVVVDFFRMDGSFFSMAVVELLELGVVLLAGAVDVSDDVDLEDSDSGTASDDTIFSTQSSFAAVFVELK